MFGRWLVILRQLYFFAIVLLYILCCIIDAPFIIVYCCNCCGPEFFRINRKHAGSCAIIQNRLTREIDGSHLFKHQVSSSMMAGAKTHFRRYDNFMLSSSYWLMKMCPYGNKIPD